MNRRWGYALALLALLLTLFSGCAKAPNQSGPTPAASTATPAPVATTALGFEPAAARMGIEMREVGGKVRRPTLAQKTLVGWARYQVSWGDLEPERQSPAQYVWQRYDETLAELAQNGLHIVATLRDNPTWAASTSCGALNAEGMKGYAQFLTALVRRYSVEPYRIKHWEIYNEPDNGDPVNFPDLGGCWGKDPAGYASILKLAYETIKAADPAAIVVFGGLALEKFDGSPFNVDFVKQVLAAGGGPYFDWMNFHYYEAFSYRWDKYGRGVEGKAAYLRQVMKDVGVEKPIACSEIGQPSAGPAAEKYSDERTMQTMAREYVQAISADMQFVVWYCWQDGKGDERKYGLLDENAERKPAFGTLVALGKALSRARFERVLGKGETGSDKIEAYLFATPADAEKSLIFAWRIGDGAAVPLAIPATRAKVVNLAGAVTEVADGDKMDTNSASGALAIGVGTAPVMIYY